MTASARGVSRAEACVLTSVAFVGLGRQQPADPRPTQSSATSADRKTLDDRTAPSVGGVAGVMSPPRAINSGI